MVIGFQWIIFIGIALVSWLGADESAEQVQKILQDTDRKWNDRTRRSY